MNTDKNKPMKVEYHYLVVEEEDEEKIIERYICPNCHFIIQKVNIGKDRCVVCNQKLNWRI